MSIPGYLSNTDLERLQANNPELRSGRCPTCRDKKKFRWKGKECDCLCSEQKRLFVRYLHAGVGDTYQRLSWGDLSVPSEQLGPVIDYLDNAEDYINRGMGLLLHGPVGTGKTLLMNLVIKELVKNKYDSYATTFANTVEAFTATWGDKEEKRIFARRFMNSQVLGLDDLGKEFRASNGLPVTTFDHILRTRVTANRPTMLTTNMSAAELQHGYGGAVLSLLVEKSIEVPLKGADFRPISHDRTVKEIRNKEIRPII